jgi:hypothetical protein
VTGDDQVEREGLDGETLLELLLPYTGMIPTVAVRMRVGGGVTWLLRSNGSNI